jgi:hypothetical protein
VPLEIKPRSAQRTTCNATIRPIIAIAGKTSQARGMDPEEAKQIAKCIVEALFDAGVQIVPVNKD